MQPIEVGVRGVERLLKIMDETKATTPRGISPSLLKRYGAQVAFYLHDLYETFARTGKLVENWKLAHIAPIHKIRLKEEIGNCRSLS